MSKLKGRYLVCFIALALCLLIANLTTAFAQEENSRAPGVASQAKRDAINYDVQLSLLVAGNDVGERSNVPPSMDGAIKQLKAALPFANYRLAATFLNRVKDGGSLEVKGVGGPLITASTNLSTPTFYEFSLYQVKADTDPSGQPFIRIPKFRFGIRMPIVTGPSHAEGVNAGFPAINYEPVGLTTEMSLREGMPTLVGTLTTARPDELLVLMVSVKRTSPH
jgi:hypothetical protein